MELYRAGCGDARTLLQPECWLPVLFLANTSSFASSGIIAGEFDPNPDHEGDGQVQVRG